MVLRTRPSAPANLNALNDLWSAQIHVMERDRSVGLTLVHPAIVNRRLLSSFVIIYTLLILSYIDIRFVRVPGAFRRTR